jgi:hypothetical protein
VATVVLTFGPISIGISRLRLRGLSIVALPDLLTRSGRQPRGWTAASIGVDSLVRSRVQSGVSRLDHYQSEGHYNLRYPFGSCWRAIRQRPLNSLELSTLPPTVSDTHLGHFALITGGLTEKNTTGEV